MTDPRRERHPLDVFSLLSGIVFLGLGAIFLLDQTNSVDVDLRWVFAALLIGLGLAGALSSIVRPRRAETSGEEPEEREEVRP